MRVIVYSATTLLAIQVFIESNKYTAIEKNVVEYEDNFSDRG